jgi:hypothetical protein
VAPVVGTVVLLLLATWALCRVRRRAAARKPVAQALRKVLTADDVTGMNAKEVRTCGRCGSLGLGMGG